MERRRDEPFRERFARAVGGAKKGLKKMRTESEGYAREAAYQIKDLLPGRKRHDSAADILAGLTGERKFISSEFFYDDTGSSLFEEITRLPEYYLNRTEKRLIRAAGGRICPVRDNTTIIELGSGDCSKITVLLSCAAPERRDMICYMPVDISRAAIEWSARELVKRFPGLRVRGVVADFSGGLDMLPGDGNRLFCFFGSTLGNLERDAGLDFIRDTAEIMNPGDIFLLGLDMVKDTAVLERAYNDGKRVTERFNKNILRVVNSLADTDFDPDRFDHVAFYNREKARIEMHLEAREDMRVSTPRAAEDIFIRKAERIHTENSHKFTEKDIHVMAGVSGLEVQELFADENKWFSLVQLKK
ncbi:MAG: L-histidine N(alpha)-methyltransferase [Candidatus Omnitrophica bacterium]|nr:L-histidine N(alpha)-methyltransferase [Candidatus Omnitrophota bacterium]